MTPRASIVIVCFGRRDMTERCLESLDRALGPSLGREIELVLVDNASPDDSLELLGAWRDRARVIALPENRHFAGGCNAGAEAAAGDALVFLNNDTIMEPGVVEALAGTVAEPGVGAAGPRLLFPDGSIQHAGVITVPGRGGGVEPFHALLYEDGDLPAGRGVFDLDCVTGACLAVDREVFTRVGGFDEAYRNGYEDIDLCFRIRMDGQRIVYRGDLAFVHEEGATRGSSAKGGDENHARFLERWGRHLHPDHDLAAAVWGARVIEGIPDRDLPAPPLMLVGQPRGTGSAADELRGLLVAASALGLPCGALELPPSYVVPPLAGATAQAVDQAIRAALPQQAFQLTVPGGPSRVPRIPEGTWVRTAGAPGPEHAGRFALPAIPAGDLPWLPPAVDAGPATGPGGGGLLVSLPAHDPRAALDVIEAVRATAPAAVRVVPTVRQQHVFDELAERLPGAELLPPCGHDDAWRARAVDADVVVCVDADDVFERRALVGAAAGAVPVLRDAGGPAGAVIPDPVCAADGSLAHAIGAALERAADRAACAAPVREQCAPATVGARLVEILNGAAAAAAA